MILIEKILYLIEKSGKSANAVSLELGLNNSAITEWKKGKAKPSTDTLYKIAQYFNVSTDYLLGLTDNPEKKEYSRTDNIKPKYQVLYENLSHTAQELICKHMTNILESEGVNVKELLSIHL